MLPKPITALSGLFSILLLTACGNSNRVPQLVVTKIERVRIPNELLYCQDEPIIPQGPYNERQIAQLFAQTRFAGKDCREKLATIRAQQQGL